MPNRPAARPAVLVAAALLLAGCASTGGTGAAVSPSSTRVTLQLRLVESSTGGPCTAPPLTTSSAGSACGTSGTTTYEVGASLADLVPTSVTSVARAGGAAGGAFLVAFDDAGTATLADVTRGAIGKDLALLVDGTVLSAPRVAGAITASQFELSTSTPEEAATVAAALHATAGPS